MMSKISLAAWAATVLPLLGPLVPVANADEMIRCESSENRYAECAIKDGSHGYVRVGRELSRTRCVQGRNWDYDRRHIWVDDGCRAEFIVEARDQSGNGAAAAAAIIGALAVGAAVASRDTHHDDENYHRGGHASYVPSWMVGDFRGYNAQYRRAVDLVINRDGRVTVRSQGQTMRGYVNDGHLYVGDHVFYVSHVGSGIGTTEIGDPNNHVFYSRR